MKPEFPHSSNEYTCTDAFWGLSSTMISLLFVLAFAFPHLVLGCDDCDICAAAFDGAVGFEIECRFCLR